MMMADVRRFPAGDPVPAVTEAAATGQVAAIFADIRATLGMPMVNLVWRHLAVRPGALEWTWAMLKPLYRSGAIAGEAAALRERLIPPPIVRWPAAGFRAVGLSDADGAAIGHVLRAYDRGNANNLMAFSALLAQLDGRHPAGTPRIATAKLLDAPLPPLLDLEAVDAATADLAIRLNRFGQIEEGPILASLYRHLAHWPGYLALAWTLLAPMEERGELAALAARTRDAADAAAPALLGGMPDAPPRVDGADRAYARTALELFAGSGIARMTAIGRLLLAAQPTER